MKKKYLIIRLILLAVCINFVLGNSHVPNAMANQDAEELQRKMADITLLKQQLEDRMQQADSVLSALKAQQKDMEAEIRVLIKSLNIKTYKQAMHHLRVQYNMELLRTIAAYTKEFNARIDFYRTGRDKLTYLHQLAADDVKMISALDNFQIDALTTQISLIVNKYLPKAHLIQIDPKELELASSQSIWNGIYNKK